MDLDTARSLVDDYVRDRLDTDHLDAFEVLLLESPELQAEVRTVNELVKALAEAPAPQPMSTSEQSPRWPTAAIAAGVLLLVSVGLNIAQLQPERTVEPVAQEARFSGMRNETQPPLELAPGMPTLMRVDVFGAGTAAIEVTITGPEGPIWSEAVAPNNDLVTLFVPGLEPGRYTLQVGAQPQQQHSFTVTNEGA